MTVPDPHPSTTSIESSIPAEYSRATSLVQPFPSSVEGPFPQGLAYSRDMHTSWPSHGLSDSPIACTLCLQEGIIGTGWLWELSPERGLVQSAFLASPGMVIKVSVQIPGVALIRLEGLVTWARVSECGMEWLHGHAALTKKGVHYETPR